MKYLLVLTKYFRFVEKKKMDILTIELKNPNAKKLIEDLADLDLISILKAPSWTERWQKLSASLPNFLEV